MNTCTATRRRRSLRKTAGSYDKNGPYLSPSSASLLVSSSFAKSGQFFLTTTATGSPQKYKHISFWIVPMLHPMPTLTLPPTRVVTPRSDTPCAHAWEAIGLGQTLFRPPQYAVFAIRPRFQLMLCIPPYTCCLTCGIPYSGLPSPRSTTALFHYHKQLLPLASCLLLTPSWTRSLHLIDCKVDLPDPGDGRKLFDVGRTALH